MLGEKPQFILDDEYDFLIAHSSEYINELSPVNEGTVINQLVVVEKTLDSISKDDPNSYLLRKTFKRERSLLLYDLLELRKNTPDITLKVQIMKYPNESLHAASNNMLVISGRDVNGNSHSFVTYIDLLAKIKGIKDSRHIVKVIGEFDSDAESKPVQYLDRIIEEGRTVKKIIGFDNDDSDSDLLLEAISIYEDLLPNRLAQLCEDEEIRIGFDRENCYFDFFNYNGSLIYSSEFRESTRQIVEASGKLQNDQPI